MRSNGKKFGASSGTRQPIREQVVARAIWDAMCCENEDCRWGQGDCFCREQASSAAIDALWKLDQMPSERRKEFIGWMHWAITIGFLALLVPKVIEAFGHYWNWVHTWIR